MQTLTLFDLLKKPDLSKSDIERIKKVAVSLLRTLEDRKREIDDWRAKEATQDIMRQSIHDFLWSDETGLPASYTLMRSKRRAIRFSHTCISIMRRRFRMPQRYEAHTLFRKTRPDREGERGDALSRANLQQSVDQFQNGIIYSAVHYCLDISPPCTLSIDSASTIVTLPGCACVKDTHETLTGAYVTGT